ncbi:hypothetical protein NFI96_026864 [Prochilodus magdalenae]|nr:hypothetical protein NFI96_026864 [Prochilodus magdalenae]
MKTIDAALTNLINMSNVARVDGGWIGLTRNQSSDKWSNGADVTFINLTGDCGSGPCCAAMKTDGSWESLTCTEKRRFMCYKQGVTDLTPSYYLISENMSWSDAQSYCRRSYTDLVSIRDQTQNEAVKRAGLTSSTSFWIGLLRDDWEWIDGGRSAYRNWGTGHPYLLSSSDCVKLRKGKWYSVPCSNANYPLCYSSKSRLYKHFNSPSSVSKSVTLHPWPWPGAPWQRIHIDFTGPFEGRMFFVAVDAHSKWPEVCLMDSTTASKTIQVLRSMFSRYGLPEVLVSDNGPQFVSDEFARFLKANGVKHMDSAPFHPATNGLAESFVQTFKHSLKSSRGSTPLQERLDAFLLHYRNSPHATTKETPTMLFFCLRLCTRLDLLKPSLAAVVSQAQETQCSYRAKLSKQRKFEVGDSVLVRAYRRGEGKWTPGNVSSKTGPVSYTVEVGSSQLWKRHTEQMLACHPEITKQPEQPPERTAPPDMDSPPTSIPTPNMFHVTLFEYFTSFNTKHFISVDGGWIGLTRNQSSDKWSNGADVTFSNLTGDCGSGSCCAAMKTDGSWENLTCTEKKPFMCYKQVYTPPEQSRLKTFHLTEKMMTHPEAQAACRTNYTGLVTVYSDEDNAALDSLAGNSATWIGLVRNQSSDKWSDGGDVTFSKLTEDCGSGPCCAAMKADGAWESLLCTEKRSFMCYKQNVPHLTLSYHVVLLNMSWSDAQSYCRRSYTDLVSIRDQNQNEAVKTAGLNSSTSFWTGLLRDDWEWTDGGRSAYRNWADGQPDPLPSACVALFSGKWYSVPCNNTHPALCYRTSIHVSDESMIWESALDYCKRENRSGLLRLESHLDQRELKFELRRRRVSGPLWVGLGQGPLSELLKSSGRLALGPWTNRNERQTQPPPSLSPAGTDTVQKSFKQKTDVSKLRPVCEVKQP